MKLSFIYYPIPLAASVTTCAAYLGEPTKDKLVVKLLAHKVSVCVLLEVLCEQPESVTLYARCGISLLSFGHLGAGLYPAEEGSTT